MSQRWWRTGSAFSSSLALYISNQTSSSKTMDKRPKFGKKDNGWIPLQRFNSTPYPSIGPSGLGTFPSQCSLAADSREWDSSVLSSTNFVESDDEVYAPLTAKQKRKRTLGLLFSWRGFANAGCLLVVVCCVLALLIGYPVITYVDRPRTYDDGGFNSGGINGTGQVPVMAGRFRAIDEDTPYEAYTRPSWTDGSPMRLVFSDEFNQDGRSFYPGDDPYWEAADLHYWATANLEWYDPAAITTAGGSLVVTLSRKETHDLNFQGGMISSWNKFCFTGGYVETSVSLPGTTNILGLWPAIWTMGNLGRVGYGATLDGMWPYSYDSCDVGTLKNQTLNGLPLPATVNGDDTRGGALSYLPGQKLSRCTCSGEDHPGPKHADGTFVGRAAPEIDIFEAEISGTPPVAGVSQSAQWAPFNAAYAWPSAGDNSTFHIANPSISRKNTYVGSATQQATSVITTTDPTAYELTGGRFAVYGFEYKPGFENGYITWISSGTVAWTMKSGAVGADTAVQVDARPVSQEPMYLIINLGISRGFGRVDLEHLRFPAKMLVDYVRVYQPQNAINVGCDPKDFPTRDYIAKHQAAYTNPNLTTWVDDYAQAWPRNTLVDRCQ